MSYRDWYVGMKVVCHRRFLSMEPFEKGPLEDTIYTIRTIEPSFDEDPDPAIRLVEIVNPPFPYAEGYHEVQFIARHFRPVQPRKTDISIFTSMLSPERGKVEA